MAAGRLSGADKIGVAVGKVINNHKMGKHFHYTITDTSLAVERRHDQIAAEAAPGIYVLRTTVDATELDAAGVVVGYKNLAHIERDFRIIKVTIWTAPHPPPPRRPRQSPRADLPVGLLPGLAP